MVRRLALILTLGAAMSGCGGGGSGGSVLPPGSGNPAPGSSGGLQTVAVSITVPAAAAPASGARRPQYISAQTKSASVSVIGGTAVVANLTPGSPNCAQVTSGLSCTLSISAPAGPDTFSATLFSQVNGAGPALSQGTAAATIVAGRTNSVALVLDGVVASIGLILTQPNPPLGSSVKIPLTITVKDAAGASIIGGDPFLSPIVLSDSDTSGATSISNSTLKSPADAAGVTVTYTGANISSASFGAKSGSVSSPAVILTPQAAASIHFNDYTTFGYDNQRTVFNPNSTAFTPATVSNIHLAWQVALGGGDFNTQTQPVLATGIAGHAGVVIVGGGRGNVYGYDAQTGASLWTLATGQETYTCENSNTIYFGIGGTAAYDPGSKSFYIVGNSNTAPNATASNSLYHIDAASGAVLGKVNFAPALNGWPSLDFSHTSVTLANGIAYVGTGATCDISSWRGRIAAVSVPSMTLLNSFFPVWDPQNTRGGGAQPWGGGGIWGWGGVSIDFNGNVLAGVGNTDNGLTTHGTIVPPFFAAPQESSGLGEALIKVSPNLASVLDFHHPIPQSMISGNSGDLDLTGTPTVFQPNGAGCNPMAALQAKSGTVYLYDTTRIGNGVVAQYQLAPSTYNDGFLGNPAYSPATGLLYVIVSSSNHSLYPPGMIAIDPGCGHPAIAWHAAFGPDSYSPGSDLNPGYQRSVPAVSAGGVVFVGTVCTPQGNGCSATTTSASARSPQSAARKPLICCAPPGSGGGAVWALDASTGEVLNGGNPLIITSGPLRVPPTIDGNWLYVQDNAGNLYALTLDRNFAATSTVQRAVDSRMLRQWEAPPKVSL